MSLPWTKFFPADWLADDGLRSVSLAARGLWIDLICLMLRSPERGKLLNPNGSKMTPNCIARRVGETPEQVGKLLDELRGAQVFSERAGMIYSRRIVRETEQREDTAKRVDKHRNKAGGNGVCNTECNTTKNGQTKTQRLRDSETQMPEAQKQTQTTDKTEPVVVGVGDASDLVEDGAWKSACLLRVGLNGTRAATLLGNPAATKAVFKRFEDELKTRKDVKSRGGWFYKAITTHLAEGAEP